MTIAPGTSALQVLAPRASWRGKLSAFYRFFVEVRSAEYIEVRLRDYGRRSQRSLLRQLRAKISTASAGWSTMLSGRIRQANGGKIHRQGGVGGRWHGGTRTSSKHGVSR